MKLTSIFAGIALALAAIGLFGVISFNVVQRTREIGIRMALGAERKSIFQLIVVNGFTLTALGLVIGIIVSLGLTRFLKSMLVEISPFDPITFLVTSAGLALVALIACYFPAHRATRIHPMDALRCE